MSRKISSDPNLAPVWAIADYFVGSGYDLKKNSHMTPCIFVMTHHEGVKYQYYARPHSDNSFDMSHDVIAARNLDL